MTSHTLGYISVEMHFAFWKVPRGVGGVKGLACLVTENVEQIYPRTHNITTPFSFHRIFKVFWFKVNKYGSEADLFFNKRGRDS